MGWLSLTKLLPKPEPRVDIYKFAPQPDMTAFELAKILQRYRSLDGGASPFQFLLLNSGELVPAPIDRHFRIIAKDEPISRIYELTADHQNPDV